MANRSKRTLKKEEKFLGILAETGNVSEACKKIPIGRRTVYEWREGLEDFAAAWDDAIETYTEALEAEADRRAHAGTERGIYYQGKRIDTVKEYSDTLLIFRLKALRPEKYRERLDAKVSGDVTVVRKVYDGPGNN